MAPRDLRTRLGRRASRAGVFLPDDLSDRLIAYYELLARWNRKINLTALDDPDAAIDRLLLEPVVAARHVPPTTLRLMDIGSGGGSPAIPLQLASPSRPALIMVEVKARKSAFLREAIRHLELDATVETTRFEELLTRPELHEALDIVSLRAVRVESKVMSTLQAFLKPGGSLFLFRGPTGPEEPGMLVPPLEWVSTYPLVESLQSRLTVVAKRDVGMGAYVPRLI